MMYALLRLQNKTKKSYKFQDKVMNNLLAEVFISDYSNENELKLLNETFNFTVVNITKTLAQEINDLKNILLDEISSRFTNLTNDLTIIKQKQNALTVFRGEIEYKLDTLSTFFDSNMTVRYLIKKNNTKLKCDKFCQIPSRIKKSNK